jgi:hypothetical protein
MGPDLHGSEVLLHLQDELGNWTVYGVPPDLAKQIGGRLVANAEEAEKIAAGKSKQ